MATKLARILHAAEPTVAIVNNEHVTPVASAIYPTLQSILNAANIEAAIQSLDVVSDPIALNRVSWLPPVDRQEIWAAGVTYRRSQTARMEESESAKDCYDRVYESERPELFFKATPSRCSGQGGDLRIRQDSFWNVPEPELTVAINPRCEIVGFTIGNDMSSRDIEGENPLYLPQAKLYDQCCGIGPYVTLIDNTQPIQNAQVTLSITREAEVSFHGTTTISEMARELSELAQWLFRDNSFPDGVFLLTGTGIIPPADFSLRPSDIVEISISGLGTLTNVIVQG